MKIYSFNKEKYHQPRTMK